jgi:dCTP deaminase
MFEAGGILTGPAIRSALFAGDIVIDPLNEDHLQEGTFVNPASYDLTLGNKIAIYSRSVHAVIGGEYRTTETTFSAEEIKRIEHNSGNNLYPDLSRALDSKMKQEVLEFTMTPEYGWYLKAGIGYLMHTVERVTTDRYIPVLDGKSSIGRLFVTAHVTAGYGDPGFDGQYTLEVVSTHPVIVYPGMRFCQMRFHTTVGEILDYKHRGHYTGKASMGPVPSMTWRQFQDMEDYKDGSS